MVQAVQIVLPTDDLRGSLVSQIDSLRRTLGRSPAVLRRSVNKQFGVSRGLDDLDERQLGEVLASLEELAERREAIERVKRACVEFRVTDERLDALMERHFDGRELGQLSAEELTELRIRIEVEKDAAAGTEPEPATALM